MSNKSAFELSKGFSPESIRSRGNVRRTGHGFQTGDVVYFDGTASDWRQSDWLYWNVTGSSEALGVVEAHDAYKFDVVYRGSILLPDTIQVTGPTETIQENTVYFLSDTPGLLTETPPEIDLEDPKVRKPILVTLNSDGAGNINGLVVNYRGYVEDTNGCVAFVQNIIPVGTIEYITSGQKSPQEWKQEGWLLCDGSEYFIDEYPDLFRVVGWAYGTPTANDRFRVPDMWNILANRSAAAGGEGGTAGAPACCCWRWKAVSYPTCNSGINCQSCCVGDMCNPSNIDCCTCTTTVIVAYQLPCIDTDGDGVPDTCDTSGINPDEVPSIDLTGICGARPVRWCFSAQTFCSLAEVQAEWNCLDWSGTTGRKKTCCGESLACGDISFCPDTGDPNFCQANPDQCGAFACNPGLWATFSDLWCKGSVCEAGGCTSTEPGECTRLPGQSEQEFAAALAQAICAACACDGPGWGGCLGGGATPTPTPTGSPVASPSPSPEVSPFASPSASPVISPSASIAVSPSSTPANTPTPTPTPSVTLTSTPTPTPSPSIPITGPARDGGRILIGKTIGASTPDDAYGGDGDIVLVDTDAGALEIGEGYASVSAGKNRQASYHANFYIRAISVERYVNIKSCNNAGGAIKNWIGNGAFNIWQRGTSFDPDISKLETDHLADLNRYTADRWFRKVGFCPNGMGATGTGAGSASAYVGKCNRKSFGTIDSTIPDTLSKQYPTNYMEYQSFISGPGADTSLEYCLLENRIGNVKTLAGETVCVSFWARADKAGSVFVNLKQHFGYDVPTSSPLTVRVSGTPTEISNPRVDESLGDYPSISGGDFNLEGFRRPLMPGSYMATGNPIEDAVLTDVVLSADASSKGANAVSDTTVLLPDAKQVNTILLQPNTGVISPELGLIQVSLPPTKIGISVADTAGETDVFFKNTNTTTNIKVEGKAPNTTDIVLPDLTNQEIQRSIPLTITYSCVQNPSCETCKPYVVSIDSEGTRLFTGAEIIPCVATLQGDGEFKVSVGESTTRHESTIPISSGNYAVLQAYVRGEAAFPASVITDAVAHANSLALQNPSACRCNAVQSPSPILGEPGFCASQMTVSKNYDASQVLGICCVVTVDSVVVGPSGAQYVTHTKIENQTVHSCAALGGQFISNDAVEYFSQFESTTCGVSEDRCSSFAEIEVTTAWQQYEVVFRIPTVESRYIGNSGTDYLALQLWTHLSNGYCRSYSGSEAPPRNRLGESYGTVECSENSLCEPCVSVFPSTFSYSGTLNLAQVQMERGTEYTGFVKPSVIEELDFCQGFYEANSCAGKGEYFVVGGADVFEHQVELKKQKICPTPRPTITEITSGPVGLLGIDILADTVTDRGFCVGGDITANDTQGYVSFSYDCDCDIYRPEELQYLTKQIEWRSVGSE
jgi:hypothetical protein